MTNRCGKYTVLKKTVNGSTPEPLGHQPGLVGTNLWSGRFQPAEYSWKDLIGYFADHLSRHFNSVKVNIPGVISH